MTDLERATGARRIAEGRYAVEIDPDWSVSGIANGGYLLAMVLRAVLDTSPHPHPVATSAHFLHRPRAGDAEVGLVPLRAGRTASAFRASLFQDGRSCIEATLTTATLDPESPPVWVGRPPTPLPPVEDCIQGEPVLPNGTPVALLKQIEVRLDPATTGWYVGQPSGVPETRGYVRLRDGHEPDPYALAVAIDALPPSVFSLGVLGWAPTVELSWHMRAVPAPGWLRVYVTGRLVRHGSFDEDAEVYDSTGQLVAQSRQLARVGSG